MMRCKYIRNSQGVALLAALFVLMVLSIIGIGLLTNVDDEIKMSKSTENSEMALKVAEAGIQVARSTFFNPAVKVVTQTEELSSIDGFYRGGYFLAQLKSGFQGAEKWTQWRYDEGVTGNNTVSEISAPVFHVWQTGANGVNGTWIGTWHYVTPIYGIVARGTYFSIENVSGDTEARAHDEYSGAQKVDRDDPDFPKKYYWLYDKTVADATLSPQVNYAINMSPMVSFSNYSSKTGQPEPVLAQQTLYFVYTGSDQNPPDSPATTDTSSTVRLRAVNALCHGTAPYDGDGAKMDTLWEFDTNMHGIGTAPAFFDPDPENPGDEILYFAVFSKGEPGSSGALDFKAVETSASAAGEFPARATDAPEQIYLFAVIDTSSPPADDCTSTGTYKVKWARPFPDPDVAEWTDYPTEHVTGTIGQDPPYVSRPSDMTPFLPEGDLLADYRDGPGVDGQWNQVRGNLFGNEISGVSPPVVKVLYRDSSNNLTELRAKAADPYNPIIDIYLMYSAFTRVTFPVMSGPYALPWYSLDVQGYHGIGWGPAGYRKPNTAQVRVLALRDQLVRSGSIWNWNAAKSRYPTFKWTYRVPGWDPDQAATPDDRPWNGYGEYTWDTYFDLNVAPMINTLAWDQDETSWSSLPNAGSQNLYNVIYPYYISTGFPTTYGLINDTSDGRRGPNTTEDSPKDFSAQSWADSHAVVMAIRDTWDDYMQGNRTNILGANLDKLNLGLSNPVEPYWTHADNNADPNTGVITYPQYAASGGSKIGFPRPYAWSESLWTANVRNAANTDPQSLYQQGWEDVLAAGATKDVSTEINLGQTTAMCTGCLNSNGLMVFAPSNVLESEAANINDAQGISTTWAITSVDRKDLRLHGINATTGGHVWDYHLPAFLTGNPTAWSPAIANNLVFAAYEKYGDKTIPDNRQARLLVLDASDGSFLQDMAVDRDADAVIMPPMIANSAVYVGTYSYGGPGSEGSGSPAADDDIIRVFAMSPVLRLVSTGVYPFDYPGAEYPFGYKHYTGGAYPFAKITSLDHDKIFMNPTSEVRGVWKRKLQVWVTGQNSKWEEVREVLEE